MRVLDRLDLNENGKLDPRELGTPADQPTAFATPRPIGHGEVEHAIACLNKRERQRLIREIEKLDRDMALLKFWSSLGGVSLGVVTIASFVVLPVGGTAAVAARVLGLALGFLAGPIGAVFAGWAVERRREKLRAEFAERVHHEAHLQAN